jgi:murein hydrolase activator
LIYLDYISRARASAVAAVKKEIERLAELEAKTELRRQEVVRVVQDTTEQKSVLDTQKKERATVLARIEGQLQAQRAEAAMLGRDDKRLSALIDDLGGQLNAAREAAEAGRKAELARLAEQERQDQARQEQTRQEQAKQEQARQAQETSQLRQRQQEASSQSSTGDSDGAGLKPGLRWPLRGAVMARFGSNRPEGGVWRGILVRAAEGASVQVVASGTVVYSNWLRGFGNLLIIDHGQQYLSVYAYNQSLLKQIGERVQTGETIAFAGSTGGQVDSALYFEIRHRGAAVDPVQFLAR